MLQGLLAAPGRIVVKETEVPPPRRGELLVRVRAALTCGTDLKAYRRGHPAIPMPGPFGHEFSGTVARRGAGVRRFAEGDAVMAVHSAPCLRCAYCKKGLHNLCENIMATKALGAFAEYILLPPHVVAQNVYPKPPRLGFEEAALLEPLSCVVHGTSPLGVRKGDTALVMGSGPIGLMHVMLLKSAGASVAVSDKHPGKLRVARDVGANLTVGAEGGHRAVRKLTGGMGFDFVFECTGRPGVWEAGVDYLRRGGTMVLFGGCPGGTRVTYDAHRLHYDEITLRGVFHFTPADVKAAYALLRGGRLPTGRLISGTYPLGKIESAFRQLERGRGIKYAIVP
ncbi:MAG: alcohol dehydrogenase catalytic domain-containing protein [Nitrospirota bacterium]